MIYTIIISLIIGWSLHDTYICSQIQYAADKVCGNTLFLFGNTITHIKCLSVLDEEQREQISNEINDPIMYYLRRVYMAFLSCIYKVKQS